MKCSFLSIDFTYCSISLYLCIFIFYALYYLKLYIVVKKKLPFSLCCLLSLNPLGLNRNNNPTSLINSHLSNYKVCGGVASNTACLSGKMVIYHRWVSLKWVLKLVPKHNMGMLPEIW